MLVTLRRRNGTEACATPDWYSIHQIEQNVPVTRLQDVESQQTASESVGETRCSSECVPLVSDDTLHREIMTMEHRTEFSKIENVDFPSRHNS